MSLRSLLAIGFVHGAQVFAQNSSSSYADAVDQYVGSISDELWPINTEIHDTPELAYEEETAHKLLTDYLSSKDGWTVEKSAYDISTAFVAVFEGSGDGPVVSFNAEYDALPDIGHACGHNLIAMASLSGALATAEVMRENDLPGKVVLFGTPAEEGGGGKIKLLDAGAYSDHKVDVSLISHPGVGDHTAWMKTTANDRFTVEYYGKEAHAAAAPWEGINAQDAMILAYNALSMLRQQSKPTDIIQGFIDSGGLRTNIIPALSTAQFQIRATNEAELKNFTERVHSCFEAGAVGTGATLNLTMGDYGYADMVTNDILARSYVAWAEGYGEEMVAEDLAKTAQGSASTDQGNISYEIPSISAGFGIQNEDGSDPESGPHTPPFEVAASSRRAFDKSLVVGRSLAGVAIDILTVDGMLDKAKEEFGEIEKVKRALRSVYR